MGGIRAWSVLEAEVEQVCGESQAEGWAAGEQRLVRAKETSNGQRGDKGDLA